MLPNQKQWQIWRGSNMLWISQMHGIFGDFTWQPWLGKLKRQWYVSNARYPEYGEPTWNLQNEKLMIHGYFLFAFTLQGLTERITINNKTNPKLILNKKYTSNYNTIHLLEFYGFLIYIDIIPVVVPSLVPATPPKCPSLPPPLKWCPPVLKCPTLFPEGKTAPDAFARSCKCLAASTEVVAHDHFTSIFPT